MDSTQETVTGDVKLKSKGNIIDAGVTSPYSLYDEEIATLTRTRYTTRTIPPVLSTSFGLPIKVQAKKD